MADGLTKTYSASLTTNAARVTKVHNMCYGINDINSYIRLPYYSKVTSATLSYSVKRVTDTSNSKSGTYGVDFYAGTAGTYIHASKQNGVADIVSGTSIKNNTTSTGSVSILGYINSQNNLAGSVSCSGAACVRIWHDFSYLLSSYTESTLSIKLTYNEPRAIVTVDGGTGSGTYHYGNTYTITASVPNGYKFVKWTDGDTNISRTFTVDSSLITAYETKKTYTAIFERIAVYVTYDSIFSFKRWAETNLSTWDLMQISNVTDAGFTGTALVEDAYTAECRPLIPVVAGKTYTFECDVSGGGFEFFVFNCNSSGGWADFTYGNTKKFDFTPSTNYISIRCDAVGTGTVVNFSNFRIYPADCSYMSDSVSAAERTDLNNWSMPTPTREGHTFKGWNTKPDGTGTVYTSGSAYPTSDLVLYSQWKKLPPEFTSANMTYMNKQISTSNKVIHNEGFIISVGVT